jgi:hypothetical protein
MMTEEDSVSTFHPRALQSGKIQSQQPATMQRKQRLSGKPIGMPKDPKTYEDLDSYSKMSDPTSRISSLETDISDLTQHFCSACQELQQQAKQQSN